MNNKNINIKTIVLIVVAAIAFAVFFIATLSGNNGDTSDNSEFSESAPLSGEYRPSVSENSEDNDGGESDVSQNGADFESGTYSASSDETEFDDVIDDTESGKVSDADITSDGSSNGEYIEYTFRSKKLLEQHYQKHGIEMGFDSPEEYERAACDVANDPDALHKTEAEDGDDVYYIEATNEFVIVSTDGYIRTYFNPDRGIDYFNRQ